MKGWAFVLQTFVSVKYTHLYYIILYYIYIFQQTCLMRCTFEAMYLEFFFTDVTASLLSEDMLVRPLWRQILWYIETQDTWYLIQNNVNVAPLLNAPNTDWSQFSLPICHLYRTGHDVTQHEEKTVAKREGGGFG